MFWESAEHFAKALELSGKGIMADIPNYTDIQPVMQTSKNSGRTRFIITPDVFILSLSPPASPRRGLLETALDIASD